MKWMTIVYTVKKQQLSDLLTFYTDYQWIAETLSYIILHLSYIEVLILDQKHAVL